MLQTQTVSSELLGILEKISHTLIFKDFLLVGGTSLALQIGHRKSIDLDFFGDHDIDHEDIISVIREMGDIKILTNTNSILITLINGVKTDFVRYNYHWIGDVIIEDNYKLANKKDIAAMKINAIIGRGSKKDFIDLYFLLREFSLTQILGFFELKYPDSSKFLAMRSLTYFEDAEKQVMPEMIINVNWIDIKNKIKTEALKLY